MLYVINTGKAKAGKSLERLLKVPDLDLTITVGRDASLKAKLSERLREYGDRVRVYGWTNQMPRLLMSHHLVIAKAGGAMVQEAIAARCPMIINQVIPGQEEGNARLIRKLGVGAVAEKQQGSARPGGGGLRPQEPPMAGMARQPGAKSAGPTPRSALPNSFWKKPATPAAWPAPLKLFRAAPEPQPGKSPGRSARRAGAALRFPHPHQLLRWPAHAARGD